MYEKWKDYALCSDLPREMFFPTDGGGVVRAQKVCAACPVAKPCFGVCLDPSYRVWRLGWMLRTQKATYLMPEKS